RALKRLRGGENGAWVGFPGAAAALADLLNDLVPVHRLFGQQREHGRPDVPASRPRSAALPVTLAGTGAPSFAARCTGCTPGPCLVTLPRPPRATRASRAAEPAVREGLAQPTRDGPVTAAVTCIRRHHGPPSDRSRYVDDMSLTRSVKGIRAS